MRIRSVSVRSVVLVAVVMMFAGSSEAQWTPSGNSTTNGIYRSGTVGVGTSSAAANQLHVFTATSLDGIAVDGSNNPAINFRNSGSIKGYFGLATSANGFFTGSAVNDLVLQSLGGKVHFVVGSGTPTLTISGANLGIGTAAPTANLHVIGYPASNSSYVTWDGADYSLMSVRSQQLSANGTHVFTSLNLGSSKFASLLGLSEDLTDGSTVNHAGVLGVGVSRAVSTQGYTAGIEGDAYRGYVAGGTTALLAGVSGYAEVDQGTATKTAAFYAWAPYSAAAPNASIGLNAGVYIDNQNANAANITNNYQLYSASTSPFVITPNGSVGVGTASPLYPLDVRGTLYFGNGPDELSPRMITYDDGWNASYVTYGGDSATRYKSTGPFVWKNVPAQGTRLTASGTQTMVLDNGGNIWTAGQIYSSSGGFKFPDGTVQTTAASGTGGGGPVTAGNVSTGNFGSTSTPGNYGFPARLDIATGGVTPRGVDSDLVIGSATPQIEFYHSAGSSAFNYDGNFMRLWMNTGSGWLSTMQWANNGKVGIASQPTFQFEVAHTSTSTAYANDTTQFGMGLINPSAVDGSWSQISFAQQGNGSVLASVGTQFHAGNKADLVFGTQTGTVLTEKMRITAAGNVGIGLVPATSSTYMLDVNGNLHASGAITGGTIYATYQDVAEWVPASADAVEPGTVVVLDPETGNGVTASATAYDTTVAGVVSEHPGVVLGSPGEGKAQIATTGRVKVKVDAGKGAIRVGDLLVTSGVAGTAMKSEPIEINGRRFHQPGTIIGKALEALPVGTGEILVLLSLQ
jgi:hypothetical protein